MKRIINYGFMLSGALLIRTSLAAQVKPGHSSTQSKKEYTMELTATQNKNKATVRRLYEEALNKGKLEIIQQIISEEYVGPRNEKGPEGFTATVTNLRAAFPDIEWTIEDLIAEDDKVVIKWLWKGTHKHPFNGFQPVNKEITNNAVVIYRLTGGKIVEVWMQSDRLGFLQQVGVVSPDILTPPAKN